MKQSSSEGIKTSIIIITRNRATMLYRCLESLVKQTRLPDEIVVVDNASNDNTKNVVLSFKKKLPIKYVVEKQIGIPYARNRGLQHTTGELILMLDDDCVADKKWVENMIKAHKKYPKAWVIQGRTYSLPKNGLYSVVSEFTRALYVRNSSMETLSLRSFFNKYSIDALEILMCDTGNFSIKFSYLKKYNLSFDTDFCQGEDKDLGRQILKRGGIVMFYPGAKLLHLERSTLVQFLEQQWHIGRSNSNLENKWGKQYTSVKLSIVEKFIYFYYFCKYFNFKQGQKMPILILLLLLGKLFRLNGYFFEKRLLSLAKR